MVHNTPLKNVYLMVVHINPFYATGLYYNPLKASKNLWFSAFFRGYRKKPVA